MSSILFLRSTACNISYLRLHRTWPFFYAATLLAIVGSLNLITADDLQYSGLTKAFLAGRLDVDPRPGYGWAETAIFNGRHYSALGPLPAVLFIPLVWFGVYHQGIIAFLGSLAAFLLCLRLAKILGYSFEDQCWFALAFCFGTSFVGVATLASSNHLSHIIAVVLLFLAITEFADKCRLPLVGALTGLAMATRGPSGLNIACFVLLVSFGADTWRTAAIKLVKLLTPFIAVAALLAAYNYCRFQNPFESGYSLQLNGFGMPYSTWNVPGNIAGPALSWSYIPKHLWIFLLGLPSYTGVGTSVLLVSPFLAYMCRMHWGLTSQLIAIGSIPVLISVLAFRSTGFEQMGYRFSLDFFPFVFWALMRSRIILTKPFKALIFTATVIDMFLAFYHMATLSLRRPT